jgi:hypothetical protein
MIQFEEYQKQKIGNLKPLSDSKFLYNALRWGDLNNEFKKDIKDFEDKEIARQDVINAYKEYFKDQSIGYMKPFLLTMVWGFADTGYGTYRTNNYISTKESREHIQTAIDYINENQTYSLRNAFNQLMKINGLGISYLTKILYFATRAKEIDNYALIFDNRVAVSLVKLTTPKEVYDIINIVPSSKFVDYQRFNNLMRYQRPLHHL